MPATPSTTEQTRKDPASEPGKGVSPAVQPTAVARVQNAADRSLLEDPAVRAVAWAEMEQRQAAAREAGRARRRTRQHSRSARRSANSGPTSVDPLTGTFAPALATPLSPCSEATDDSSPADLRGAARQVVNLVSTAAQSTLTTGQEAADDGTLKRLRLRDQRRRLREAIQRFTRLSGLKGCGTRLTGERVGVHVGKAAARFAGLQSCHSVWSCPICQARIRAARSVELEKAALAWLKAGHGLYMATLTVPHWSRVRLASQVKDGHKCAGQRSCTCRCKCPVLAPARNVPKPPCTCACPVDPGQLARVVEAWRGVQGGTWWTGRHVIRDGAPALWSQGWEDDDQYVRRQEFDGQGRPAGPATVWQNGFRDRWGIVGTTRTIEITYGANGWHSHAHVLIWTEDPATEARAEAIEEELYARWAKRCKAVGLPTPARGEIREKDGKRVRKGVDVTPVTIEKAGPLAKYVVKLQEGGALAMEMTRYDLKVARGEKGMTALELAAIAAAGNGQAIELWREYEFATRGIQCLTWSQGLRERLAHLVELDEREDDQIPDEETAETPEAPSLLITREAWWRSIVPVHGARADILHAAEVGGLPGAIGVLDKLGLVHGVDYGPPDQMSGPVLPSIPQLRRGQAARTARRDRRKAVDDAVLTRTPAQWAHGQEQRRAATQRQTEARAAQTTATNDKLAAADARRAQAADEFARRRAALRHNPAAASTFEHAEPRPVRLSTSTYLDDMAAARQAPPGAPACTLCGGELATALVPVGRHTMC
ncbi:MULTISPECIES: hypothetical protein [Streptomyces]|nr:MULTISPECIES: hypothetical protein [Streptomyces]MYS65148.1 hypothetical protein [Streptomyces sp. SID5473]